ncbi:MAG: hypothetical protein HY216_02010 [Candidatus Rokubacteria bacterium]|nr:hypothetical protein [Candidatus Rokubacteria bacterium]
MEVVRFWCREVDRDVEVTLEGHAIVACTAFDSPTAIACRRQCMDTMYRWRYAPPTFFDAPKIPSSR